MMNGQPIEKPAEYTIEMAEEADMMNCCACCCTKW